MNGPLARLPSVRQSNRGNHLILSRHLHRTTRTHHGSHARALGPVATRLLASLELREQRRLAGLRDDWRQASTKAHDVVRATADGVRAVLVVRVNGPVESAV